MAEAIKENLPRSLKIAMKCQARRAPLISTLIFIFVIDKKIVFEEESTSQLHRFQHQDWTRGRAKRKEVEDLYNILLEGVFTSGFLPAKALRELHEA